MDNSRSPTNVVIVWGSFFAGAATGNYMMNDEQDGPKIKAL